MHSKPAAHPHIMAVLLATRPNLDAICPLGRLYGEPSATALAVYLLTRYNLW
jgi:hypothetical protein